MTEKIQRLIDDIVSCADEADGGKEDARAYCEQLVALLSTPAPVAAPPADLVAILRKAQDFVALANTVWTEDSDGRWAAKLADKRMAVLAEEIAAFPLPEVPYGR
jgi:hypothetical protein